MCQASAFNPPHCATLWLVCEVHQVGATHILPSPCLLPWALRSCKVSSGQFSSPIELSLSGHCYLSEPLLSPFDQSMRRPKWEQISLPPPPLGWPLHARDLYTEAEGLFLSKSPWLWPAIPNKHLAFHLDQLSDQFRDHLDHSQSQPISSPISRCYPVPQFLWYCPSWRPQSQPGYGASCVSVWMKLRLYPSSEFKCPGLSWLRSVISPLWEGREPLSYNP